MLKPIQKSLYGKKYRKDKPRGRQGISQKKKQEIKEAFDLFDTDGSGTQIIYYVNVFDVWV